MLIRKAVAVALAGVLLFTIAGGELARARDVGRRACRVEVLSSEDLPVGPLFYHTVRATLSITSPDGPPVVRSVEKVIPWQVPPPRQGQRLKVACDAEAIHSAFGFDLARGWELW